MQGNVWERGEQLSETLIQFHQSDLTVEQVSEFKLETEQREVEKKVNEVRAKKIRNEIQI